MNLSGNSKKFNKQSDREGEVLSILDALSNISNVPGEIEILDFVNCLLATLTPLEQDVLRMRFRLLEGHEHSAREIAASFSKDWHELQPVKINILRKLRNAPSLNTLKSFIKSKEEQLVDKPSPIELIPAIEKVQQLTPELIEHLRLHDHDLDDLRWDVFEHLIAEFFASWGWDDVRLVGRNHKTSADIFAAHIINPLGIKIRYFVEVKRWKHKVGVQVIDQVYGAMISEKSVFGWHAAMIVSTVGFKDFEKYSREALALRGVELKDRDDLLRWLKGYKRNKDGLWLPRPLTDLF